MSNHPAPTPAPPLWRAPRRWPGADTAHRGADMCRAALGLPPPPPRPLETPPEDHRV
jgi:hypothetical protein